MAASFQSQHCSMKEYSDSSRISIPTLNVSGALDHSKEALRFAKCPNKGLKGSGNVHTSRLVSRVISWTIVCWTYISLMKDCVEGRRTGGLDARFVISGGSGVCGISSTS